MSRAAILLAFAGLPLGCAHHRTATGPAPPDASLIVRGPPGAQLFVDDRYRGLARGNPLPIRSGQHRVEVRADGMFAAYRDVTISPGERRQLDVALRPDLDAAAPR